MSNIKNLHKKIFFATLIKIFSQIRLRSPIFMLLNLAEIMHSVAWLKVIWKSKQTFTLINQWLTIISTHFASFGSGLPTTDRVVTLTPNFRFWRKYTIIFLKCLTNYVTGSHFCLSCGKIASYLSTLANFYNFECYFRVSWESINLWYMLSLCLLRY